MIIYAWMAEVSIAKLFFAGFLPGLIACASMMGLCYYYARKYNLVEQKFSIRGRPLDGAGVLGAVHPGGDLGILGGMATATEVAALRGGALVIGLFIYRELAAPPCISSRIRSARRRA